MAEYLERHAEPAGEESVLPPRINIIPHQCTAANTKLRFRSDYSARFNGTSVNDKFLHGPDLTNSLMDVLLRLRQFPIGIVGDIKAMISQVLVDEDRDALRFLWFKDGDLNQPEGTY